MEAGKIPTCQTDERITLKSYSSTYDCQARSATIELDDLPTDMDERQASVGMAMQAIAEVRFQLLGPSNRDRPAGVRLPMMAAALSNQSANHVVSSSDG
jgi:hypothetical protein